MLGSVLTALLATKGNLFAAWAPAAPVTAAEFDVEAQQNLADRRKLTALRRVVQRLPASEAVTDAVTAQLSRA